MSNVFKGKVYELEDGRARLKTYTASGYATPLLEISEGVDIAIGDIVAYALFDDGTGIILAKVVR